MSSKSNIFNGWNYLDQLGESSFMPNYYQQEMNEPMTFRSLSPKMYNQKTDYFESDPELADDNDALYEAMLLNSNFLETLGPSTATAAAVNTDTTTSSINRLCQLLNHLNPNYSPLAQVLEETPSIRSQFSNPSQQPSQPIASMVGFSIPDPRDPKGKGKFKPTI